jgi:hypothetical protein
MDSKIKPTKTTATQINVIQCPSAGSCVGATAMDKA